MKKTKYLLAILLLIFSLITTVWAVTWISEEVGNAPGNVKDVEIGDPDNDLINEIITGDDQNQIVIHEKIQETWGQIVVESDVGATVNDLAIGDANNDGENEIVAVIGEGNPKVLLFNGSGNFWTMNEIDSISTGYGTRVDIGDPDNDGKNEIVVTTSDSDLYVYEIEASNWIQRVLSTNLGGNILGFAIGDANNDDLNEIVVGSYEENLYIFSGSGQSWTNFTIGSNIGWPIHDVAIGDADNDGKNEIVVGAGHYSGYGYSSGGASYLYKNIGGTWYKYDMGATGSDYYVARVEIADIDDDGDKEVVAGWGSGFYYRYGRVYLGNGTYNEWTWTEMENTQCGTQDEPRLSVADFDSDFTMEMAYSETGRTYIKLIYEEDPPENSHDPRLVVRGSNNLIYYRQYNLVLESWGGWTALPGSTGDTPAATICNNELHVVVRGMDDTSLYHGFVNLLTDEFSGWSWMSGSTPSIPRLVSDENSLYLVVRGDDNRIYLRSYDLVGESWGAWSVAPTGTTMDSPGACVDGNYLNLVVRGMDDSIYHQEVYLPTMNYLGWSNIGGSTPSVPALTSNYKVSGDDHLIYLVVRGSDNGIYLRSYDGTWTSWTKLSGSTNDAFGACIQPSLPDDDACLHIVVRGMDGAMYHGKYDLNSETFLSWTQISGETPSPPTLTS